MDATLSFPPYRQVYVRGSDGAAWVLEGGAAKWDDGWQSLGGLFTSGLVTISHSGGVVGGPFIYGRGLDNRLYEKRGNGPGTCWAREPGPRRSRGVRRGTGLTGLRRRR